jgi:hypothetical protein
MNMAKYRIRVEVLDPKEKVSEEMLAGWECDGFFMCASLKDDDDTIDNTVAIHDTNAIDMAKAIFNSTELMGAAMIAHGMEEARLMKRNRKELKVSKAFNLADALRKIMEDE